MQLDDSISSTCCNELLPVTLSNMTQVPTIHWVAGFKPYTPGHDPTQNLQRRVISIAVPLSYPMTYVQGLHS